MRIKQLHLLANNIKGWLLALGGILANGLLWVLPKPLLTLAITLSRLLHRHPLIAKLMTISLLPLILSACAYQPYQTTVYNTTGGDSFANSDTNLSPEVSAFQKVVMSICNDLVETVVGIANTVLTLALNFQTVDFTKTQTTCTAITQQNSGGFSISTAPNQIVATWGCGVTNVWGECVQVASYLLILVVAINFLRNLIEGFTTPNNFKVVLKTVLGYIPIIMAIYNTDLILTIAFDIPLRLAAIIKATPVDTASAIVQSLYKVSLTNPPDFNVVVVGAIFGLFYSYYALWLSWRYFIRLILAYFCFAISPLTIFCLTTKESKRFFNQWLSFLTPLIIAPLTVGINFAIATAVLNTNINDIPDPYTHGYSWAVSMMFAIIMLAFANKMLAMTVGPVGQAADSLLQRGIGTFTNPVRSVTGRAVGIAGDAGLNVARRGGGLVLGGIGAGALAVAGILRPRRKTAAERESSSGDSSATSAAYNWPTTTVAPLPNDDMMATSAAATASSSSSQQIEFGQQLNSLLSIMSGLNDRVSELSKALAASANNNSSNNNNGNYYPVANSGGNYYAPNGTSPIWIQQPIGINGNGGAQQQASYPTMPLNANANPAVINNGNTNPMAGDSVWPLPYATMPTNGNGGGVPSTIPATGVPSNNNGGNGYQYPPRLLPLPTTNNYGPEADWGLPPMLPAAAFNPSNPNNGYYGNNSSIVYNSWPTPDQPPMNPAAAYYYAMANPTNGNTNANQSSMESAGWGFSGNIPGFTNGNGNNMLNPTFYPVPSEVNNTPQPLPLPFQPANNNNLSTRNNSNSNIGAFSSSSTSPNDSNNNSQTTAQPARQNSYAEIEVVAARFRYTLPSADMVDPYNSGSTADTNPTSDNIIDGTARPVLV